MIATGARADTPPNLWDLGKRPDALAQYRQHVDISRKIDLVDELSDDSSLMARAATTEAEFAARELADVWHGPKDAWLQFDDAWIAMKRFDYAQAVTLLEPLTKSIGATPFASEVWMKLAECYVKLERTDDEIHAYDEVLARTTTEVQRMTPLMNQGEAVMRSGDAQTALAQFRDVLRLSAQLTNATEISMLAQWDVAIALDRSGDFRGALAAAVDAVRMSKYAVLVISPLNPSVYFVPDYEREWYSALSDAALALNEQDKPSAVALMWRDAVKHMQAYVAGAEQHAGGDKWLDVARKRVEMLRQRRDEADKKAGVEERDL